MLHRLVLTDIFFATLIAISLTCGFAPNAYAYVDPSVMTYTIQALAGVAVALSTVAGVLWRRMRRKAMNKLGIDENANKDVEPDIHRLVNGKPIDAGGRFLTDAEIAAAAPKKRIDKAKEPLSWKKRLGFSAAVSCLLVFTIFILAPYEIVAANTDSLVFGLNDIWMPMALFGAAVVILLSLALSAIRGKAFDIALAVIFAFSIGAYAQAMFLNTSLPSATGVPVQWSDYKTITAISTAVWAAVFVAVFILRRKKTTLFRSVALVASLGLVVVQAVGVASLWLSPTSTENNKQVYVTQEGLFDVSPNSNVIVFVLDTFDTSELIKLSNEDPSVLSEMTGFTFFTNSTGSLIPTRWAVPFMLTGQLPQDDETIEHYAETRYKRSDFLTSLKKQGYTLGIYSDAIENGLNLIAADTVNIHGLKQDEISHNMDAVAAITVLSKCALYRDMPWLFKKYFWFYTDEINNVMTGGATSSSYGEATYSMNDARYYSTLTTNKLTVNNDSGSFRFIHLNGSHEPFLMDENAHSSTNSSLDQQSKGAMRITSEYIKQLKELGVYDNTTIIITADHGNWEYTMDDIHDESSPIMLVKPATNSALASTAINSVNTNVDRAIAKSNAPVSHTDLQATILAGANGDFSKYGKTVYQIPNEARDRYYCMTTNDYVTDYEFRQFHIRGNVLDFNNWRLTGKEWVVNPRHSHSRNKADGKIS